MGELSISQRKLGVQVRLQVGNLLDNGNKYSINGLLIILADSRDLLLLYFRKH
jgi:hypothetical protein